jgi:hypothetical protein
MSVEKIVATLLSKFWLAPGKGLNMCYFTVCMLYYNAFFTKRCYIFPSFMQANFSQWCKNKRNSPVSLHTLRRYFLHGEPCDDDSIGRLPIIHELGSLLVHFSTVKKVEAVVFIDADNRIESMDWLRWIGPANGADWSVQVIATIRHSHYSYRMSGADIRPWVTVVQSSTQKKQAVDLNVTLQVAMIHEQLKGNPEIPFFIITHDHFALEIVAAMMGNGIDRPCFGLNEVTAPLDVLMHSKCAGIDVSPDAAIVRSLCSEDIDCDDIVASVTQSAPPFDFELILSQYIDNKEKEH